MSLNKNRHHWRGHQGQSVHIGALWDRAENPKPSAPTFCTEILRVPRSYFHSSFFNLALLSGSRMYPRYCSCYGVRHGKQNRVKVSTGRTNADYGSRLGKDMCGRTDICRTDLGQCRTGVEEKGRSSAWHDKMEHWLTCQID